MNKPLAIFLFSCSVGFAVSTNAVAQTPLYPSDSLKQNPFIQMNPTRVSSGILEDLGDNLVGFKLYNGQSLVDSNYVSFEILTDIYQSVKNSSFSQIGFPTTSTYRDSLSRVFDRGNNPVTVLFYRHHFLKENALRDSLVVQKPDLHIEDRYNSLGEWVNPYDSSYVFAFAPYMDSSDDEVCFYFRNDFILSNYGVTSMQFDPGDGAGYRSIALSGTTTVNVDYNVTESVVKELKLRLILANNTVLEAHSPIALYNAIPLPEIQPMSATPTIVPDLCISFTATQSYMGYQPTAKMYVFFANGRTALQKPFVYAECFDPLPDINSFLYNPYQFGHGMMTYNAICGISDSLATDYDYIYVDWQQSTAPIEANSSILQQVLSWVNQNKANNADKNILMGHSMGGLIARYTLCRMEQEQIPHDVKTFISYDAPHFGANVPTGYVYAAQCLFKMVEKTGLRRIIDLLLNAILSNNHTYYGYSKEQLHALLQLYWPYILALRDAPSVQQMLWNYVDNNLSPNPGLYNQFQNQLRSMGMPNGDSGNDILNLCISNGGTNRIFSERTQQDIFHISGEVEISFLSRLLLLFSIPPLNCIGNQDYPLGLLPGRAGYQSYVTIKTDINNPNIVFDAKSVQRKDTIFGTSEKVHWEKTYRSTAASHGYDDAYGSFFEIDASFGQADGNTLDIPHWLGGASWEYQPPKKKFVFVPTVSSLAYKKNKNLLTIEDYLTDFKNTGLDFSMLPFNGYHMPDSSCNHKISARPESLLWADRMQDLSLLIPSTTPISGYTYTILDSHPEKGTNYTVTWSTSDSSKATVSSTGVLTIGFGGQVIIYADVLYQGGHLILSHAVTLPLCDFPGFPNYSLSVQDGVPNQNGMVENYIVTATALSSLPDSITRKMTYWWGLKKNNNDSIVWTSQRGLFGPSPTELFIIPEASNCRMVFFYATYGGYTSPTYSITCWISGYVLLLNPDGYIFVPGEINPIVQVKGDSFENPVRIIYSNHEIDIGTNPSLESIITALLNNDSFEALIKTLKPWGTENMLLIPFKLCMFGKEPENRYICIVYKEIDYS